MLCVSCVQFFPTSGDRTMNGNTDKSGESTDVRENIARILQHGDADDIGMMLEQFQAEYTEVNLAKFTHILYLFDVCIICGGTGHLSAHCIAYTTINSNLSI